MNGHDPVFQINDIQLNISPENITIDRAAQIKQYKPLRTKGTAKVRSPSSVISVMVQTKFVGTDQINNQLRPLLAQFLLTPFCYVHNQYLKDALQGNDQQSENLALALQNLTISTVEGLPDTWNVVFSFIWFNYKPYTKSFFFKNSIFGAANKNKSQTPGLLGSGITAFQLFYKNQLSKLRPVTLTNSSFGLATLEFLLSKASPNPDVVDDDAIDHKRLQDFTQESLDILEQTEQVLGDTDNIDALQLRKQIASFQSSDSTVKTVQSTVEAISQALSRTKVLKPNNSAVDDLLKRQDKLIKDSSLIFKDNVWLEFPADATKAPNQFKNSDKTSSKLYYRARSISTGGNFHSGLVATSITLNFNHKLAILPLQGYQYPTAQHLGSSDIEFSVQIACLDDESNRHLADFWNVCQNNLQYGRFISQDITTVEVFNELFAFAGVSTVLIAGKRDATVQGQPGLYNHELQIVENQLPIRDLEQITSIPTSFQSVRKLIWKAIFNNLTFAGALGFFNFKKHLEWAANPNIDPASQEFLNRLINQDITLSNVSLSNGLDEHASDLFDALFSKKSITLITESIPRNVFQLSTGLSESGVLGITGLNDAFYQLIAGNPTNKDLNDLRFHFTQQQDTVSLLRTNQLKLQERLDALRTFQSAKTVITENAFRVKSIDANNNPVLEDGTVIDMSTILTTPDLLESFREKMRFFKALQAGDPDARRKDPGFVISDIRNVPSVRVNDALRSIETELVTLENSVIGGHVKDPFLDLFTGWQRYAVDTADEIIDKFLSLEIFKEAKREYDSLQKKVKKSLYRDMHFSEIESQIRQGSIPAIPEDIDFEPDFYFWNETLDEGTVTSLNTETVQKVKEQTLQYVSASAEQNTNWYNKVYLNKSNPELRGFLDKTNPGNKIQSIADPQPVPGLSQINGEIDISSKSANAASFDTAGKKFRISGSISANTNQAGVLKPVSDTKFLESVGIHAQNTEAADDMGMSMEEVVNTDETRSSYSGWVAPLSCPMHITSIPGLRNDAAVAAFGGSNNHKGTDIVNAAGDTFGQPVFSSLEGEVFQNFFEEGGGWNIGIRSQVAPWGEVRILYLHLAIQAGTEFTDSPKTNPLKVGSLVSAGQQIGYVGSTGHSTGPHLHYEVQVFQDGVKQFMYPFGGFNGDIVRQNPEFIVTDFLSADGSATNNTYLPHAGLDGIGAGLTAFDLSLRQLQASWNKDAGYRMGRAYPSVYLAFIEEDLDDTRIMKFDDYFSFQSIVSLYCVKDREVPADYVYMQLTNVSGLLSNRKFRPDGINDDKPISTATRTVEALDADVRKDPSAVNTDEEFKFESLMLREGIKVEIRLGYSDKPDNLEIVFVGRIVGTQFSESDDLVDVEMQSLATELVQDLKGQDKAEKKNGLFVSDARTGPLLESLISSPECVSFGFWKRGMRDGNTDRDLLTSRWSWNPEPSSDNIFAPPSDHLDPRKFLLGSSILSKLLFGSITAVAAGAGVGFALGASLPAAAVLGLTSLFGASGTAVFGTAAAGSALKDFFGITGSGSPFIDVVTKGIFSALTYYLYQTTIWDVFKEMEHRHPDCIASPVPYIEKIGARTRMTMFFGNPDWLYFCRDPSGEAKAKTQEIESRKLALRAALTNRAISQEDRFKAIQEFAESTQLDESVTALLPRLIENIQNPEVDAAQLAEIDKAIQDLRLRNSITEGSIRPFRRYHIITSQQHIIANNIRAKSTSTFNAVTINYASSDEDIRDDENGPEIKDVEELTMKLDPLIPDEEVRESVYTYPNCQGDAMATRYALSHLQKGCWSIYQGDIVILGNPSIRPYDIVFVYDEYSDIYGPVQVRRVTHMFDYEHGFITIITPDLLTTLSEGTTVSHTFAMGLMAERLLGLQGTIESLPSHPDANDGVISPWKFALGNAALGIASVFGMKKLLFVTQFGHPIRIHPLIHNGQAMVAGFGPPGVRENEFIINDLYQWVLTRSRAVGQSLEDFKRMWDNREGILNTRGKIFSNEGVFGGNDLTALTTGRKK